jgi:Major Facilitator Superfamily
MLIAGGALQGLGGAVIAPASLSILTTTFEEGPARNRTVDLWGAMEGAGGAAGVLAGGVLTDLLGWRWILFINVPIGLVVAVLAHRLIAAEPRAQRVRSFDLAGALTATLRDRAALPESRVKAVDPGQMGIRELKQPGLQTSWGHSVRLERSDADLHPAVEWQRAEHTVELCFAVGAVQAEGLPLARRDGWSPQPHQMSLAGQLRRGDRLGAHALFDLGLRGALRNMDIELSQELHDLLPLLSRDELLAAVDVVRRAGERRVGHDVNSQRGHVGGADDAADRESRTQLVPAVLELISEQ